jgi:hypothetical protein
MKNEKLRIKNEIRATLAQGQFLIFHS